LWEGSWLESRVDLTALRISIGADMREVALLWLVFTVLDMLIQGKITVAWIAANAAGSVVVWVSARILNTSDR
jgi:hypothetical protein